MKDFVSVKEAAESRNVSERRVHKYCEIWINLHATDFSITVVKLAD